MRMNKVCDFKVLKNLEHKGMLLKCGIPKNLAGIVINKDNVILEIGVPKYLEPKLKKGKMVGVLYLMDVDDYKSTLDKLTPFIEKVKRRWIK